MNKIYFLLSLLIICSNLFTLYGSLLIKYDSPYVKIDQVTKPQYYYSNKTKEQLNTPPIPLSKRFVLLILDGCRADSFFINQNDYFQSKMLEGQFGLSITEVPTETRTCHMNLFSGRPEDPNSLFYGWTKTPHEFDSIWFHLNYSLLVGPESAIMNYKNMQGKKINTGEKIPKNKHFILRMQLSSEILMNQFPPMNGEPDDIKKMNFPKTGYFLNFEGVDSAGHFYDSKSVKYFRLLNHASNEIKKIEKIVNNHFEDKLTTFIVTSDHGMSEQGAHGGESKYELTTPYLIWGNGISKSKELMPNEKRVKSVYEFEDFDSWNFPKNRKRIDIEQNSIASLLSSTLGVGFPANSIGIINENILYPNNHYRAASLLTNFKQLYTLFDGLLGVPQSNTQFPIYIILNNYFGRSKVSIKTYNL
ncbi:phosphatidylinositol glycan [Anaeramoeba flamelloides]|uniref:GPI ethanolamine phosphate transferase 1 n=1 Tax=Anaeramoeba flamelloides TaxID=1746091 RepID=A0ABQ8XHS7_9EUKA|nr:phosphatidylinositol glycan [Anaeramoeba flamelloides]